MTAKATAKNGMNSSEINSATGIGSKWAADMQTHFAQTGSYRSEDLRRVLGDPLSGISIPTHNPADHTESDSARRLAKRK
jgi:hypothetical protein